MIAILSSGCSFLIAYAGKDLSKLETREKVHEVFNKPTLAGYEDNRFFEEFRTRRKVSESLRASHLAMSVPMTFGLGELVAFPYELYLLGRNTILGQTIRFTYDSEGRIIRITLDGELTNWPTTPNDESSNTDNH